MLILQIAAGIVLGAAAVAFLKTPAGRYTLLGIAGAIVIGSLWAVIVLGGLADGLAHGVGDDRVRAWMFWSIPVVGLLAAWWLPRTVALYRRALAYPYSDGDQWRLLRLSSGDAFRESLWCLFAVCFVAALVIGPLVWWLGSGNSMILGRAAAVLSWALLAFVGACAYIDRLLHEADTTLASSHPPEKSE